MSLLERDEVPAAKSLASTRPDREPAGGGVQRHARADHPAADDQHLMLGAGQRRERRGPRVRAQPDRTGRFGHHMRNASICKRVTIPLVSAEAVHSG